MRRLGAFLLLIGVIGCGRGTPDPEVEIEQPTSCSADTDCRACPLPGCGCGPSRTECAAPDEACFADPCRSARAVCRAGQCALEEREATSNGGACLTGECEHLECFRAVTCARACGQPAVACGCCGCAEGWVDEITCQRAPAPAPALGSGDEGAPCGGVGGAPCDEGLLCAHPGGPTPGLGVCSRPGSVGTSCDGSVPCNAGLECRSVPGGFRQCEPPL